MQGKNVISQIKLRKIERNKAIVADFKRLVGNKTERVRKLSEMNNLAEVTIRLILANAGVPQRKYRKP